MSSPERIPVETRKPLSGYLWGALAVLTCPCHLPVLAAVLWNDRWCFHRGALGCCSHCADRLIRPFSGTTAAGLQGKIVTVSQPAG